MNHDELWMDLHVPPQKKWWDKIVRMYILSFFSWWVLSWLYFGVLTIFFAKRDYILWPPNLLRCSFGKGRFTTCSTWSLPFLSAFAWQTVMTVIHRQGFPWPWHIMGHCQVSLDEVISSPAKFCHELKSHGYAIVQCNLLRRLFFVLGRSQCDGGSDFFCHFWWYLFLMKWRVFQSTKVTKSLSWKMSEADEVSSGWMLEPMWSVSIDYGFLMCPYRWSVSDSPNYLKNVSQNVVVLKYLFMERKHSETPLLALMASHPSMVLWM